MYEFPNLLRIELKEKTQMPTNDLMAVLKKKMYSISIAILNSY